MSASVATMRGPFMASDCCCPADCAINLHPKKCTASPTPRPSTWAFIFSPPTVLCPRMRHLVPVRLVTLQIARAVQVARLAHRLSHEGGEMAMGSRTLPGPCHAVWSAQFGFLAWDFQG